VRRKSRKQLTGVGGAALKKGQGHGAEVLEKVKVWSGSVGEEETCDKKRMRKG